MIILTIQTKTTKQRNDYDMVLACTYPFKTKSFQPRAVLKLSLNTSVRVPSVQKREMQLALNTVSMPPLSACPLLSACPISSQEKGDARVRRPQGIPCFASLFLTSYHFVLSVEVHVGFAAEWIFFVLRICGCPTERRGGCSSSS